jgi:hypothetical protein
VDAFLSKVIREALEFLNVHFSILLEGGDHHANRTLEFFCQSCIILSFQQYSLSTVDVVFAAAESDAIQHRIMCTLSAGGGL